jgi:hypothetical protein
LLRIEHTRTRIVEGHTKEGRPEEIVNSIERILSKSSEKRRHRKTHGRISFGDLARTIADKWKAVDPQSKAIFDQYAEVDMHRYRTEVQKWKDKKEREAEAASIGGFNNSMNTSLSSVDSNDPEFGLLNDLPSEGSRQQPTGASWQPRNPSSLHDSLNSSYASTDSRESELSIEPMPINTMQLQMQMQMQVQQMQMQLQQRYHPQQQQHNQQQQQQHNQQQQQQQYLHGYQQQQAHPQANFITNANQGPMPSFPAIGGGYGNASFNIMAPPGIGGGYGNASFNIMAPGNYGNASTSSQTQHDSLLGVSSSQISDYTSNHTSGGTSGNFSSSYASGGTWGV